MTTLSVVIRTWNSAATLPRVLARVRCAPGDELIVVDSGSTDGTLAVANAAGARIVPLRKEAFTYGRSLNLGFEAAQGDWVLSLSSHAVPVPEDLLAVYRAALGRLPERVVAAVGPILFSALDRKFAAGITLFEGEDLTGGFGFGAGNPNALYRRRVWREHPFDEVTEAAEDMEWYVWALRQGYGVAAIHAAEVEYRSVRSARFFFHKGRIDHRALARWIRPQAPSLSVLVSHTAKLGLYGLMGKIGWQGAKASFFHYLGSFYEARRARQPSAASAGR